MSKYNGSKFLKRTKARVSHRCNLCGQLIPIGGFYYAEELKDKFLHLLHKKKFCSNCYNKFGEKLLKTQRV